MDNRFDGMDIDGLLREIAATQRHNARAGRIAAAAVILLAAALLVSLLILVPKLTGTLDRANAILDDVQQTLQRVNTSLDTLDSLGNDLRSFSDEGTQHLQKLMDALNKIDLDALTRSIQGFNGVLEGFSNFKLFG